MELGNDNATGNAWRVIDANSERLKKIDDVIWKGNGKDALVTQLVRLRTEIRTIALVLGIMMPVAVKVIDVLWTSHAH
jgi:hypothetical protein